MASGSLYATRTDSRDVPPVLISASTTLRPPDRGKDVDADQNLPAVCIVGWPATGACPTGTLWDPGSAGCVVPPLTGSWGIRCVGGVVSAARPESKLCSLIIIVLV